MKTVAGSLVQSSVLGNCVNQYDKWIADLLYVYIEAIRDRHLGGYLGRDPLLRGFEPLFCGMWSHPYVARFLMLTIRTLLSVGGKLFSS